MTSLKATNAERGLRIISVVMMDFMENRGQQDLGSFMLVLMVMIMAVDLPV